jgi:hypothetical protein
LNCLSPTLFIIKPIILIKAYLKVHEHDSKPPQGFGLIYKGRLVCFYDAECDLGDGWESAEIHKDSPGGA